MNVDNKTPKTTSNSQPDMHHYQVMFNEDEVIKQNQSVTLHDHPIKKKSKKQLTLLPSDLSLTKQTYNNINTIIKFTQKTYQQIKQHQQITLSQNLLSSIKETNNILYTFSKKVVKMIPKVKNQPIQPPQKILSGWFYKIKEKCSNNKKQQLNIVTQVNNGYRDEDDEIII